MGQFHIGSKSKGMFPFINIYVICKGHNILVQLICCGIGF